MNAIQDKPYCWEIISEYFDISTLGSMRQLNKTFRKIFGKCSMPWYLMWKYIKHIKYALPYEPTRDYFTLCYIYSFNRIQSIVDRIYLPDELLE